MLAPLKFQLTQVACIANNDFGLPEFDKDWRLQTTRGHCSPQLPFCLLFSLWSFLLAAETLEVSWLHAFKLTCAGNEQETTCRSSNSRICSIA